MLLFYFLTWLEVDSQQREDNSTAWIKRKKIVSRPLSCITPESQFRDSSVAMFKIQKETVCGTLRPRRCDPA